MFRNGLEPWHVAVLALVLILLFGSKRLPDGARSLGRSLRIFKSELKSMQEDDHPAAGTTPGSAPAQPGATGATGAGGTTESVADPAAPAESSRPETPPRVDG